MNHMNLKSTDTFEETGLLMKKLIFKLVQSQPDVHNWIKDVNAYFESTDFKRQSTRLKEKDIFEARLYIKMAIQQYGLANFPYKKMDAQ